MGPWGFVFLAYGIVWSVILLYVLTLKHRIRRAEAELAGLPTAEDIKRDAKA
jgi:CcmD family protein